MKNATSAQHSLQFVPFFLVFLRPMHGQRKWCYLDTRVNKMGSQCTNDDAAEVTVVILSRLKSSGRIIRGHDWTKISAQDRLTAGASCQP